MAKSIGSVLREIAAVEKSALGQVLKDRAIALLQAEATAVVEALEAQRPLSLQSGMEPAVQAGQAPLAPPRK